MTSYVFVGPGKAMQSVVVIVSPSYEKARDLLSSWCRTNNLPCDGFKIADQWLIEAPAVIYSWDGDY